MEFIKYVTIQIPKMIVQVAPKGVLNFSLPSWVKKIRLPKRSTSFNFEANPFR